MRNDAYEITVDNYLVDADLRKLHGITVYENADEDGNVTVVTSAHDIKIDRRALAKFFSL